MVKSYRRWWGGVVAYWVLVSLQSQLDFGFFASLGLVLGLGLGGLGLGLGLDNIACTHILREYFLMQSTEPEQPALPNYQVMRLS